MRVQLPSAAVSVEQVSIFLETLSSVVFHVPRGSAALVVRFLSNSATQKAEPPTPTIPRVCAWRGSKRTLMATAWPVVPAISRRPSAIKPVISASTVKSGSTPLPASLARQIHIHLLIEHSVCATHPVCLPMANALSVLKTSITTQMPATIARPIAPHRV